MTRLSLDCLVLFHPLNHVNLPLDGGILQPRVVLQIGCFGEFLGAETGERQSPARRLHMVGKIARVSLIHIRCSLHTQVDGLSAFESQRNMRRWIILNITDT